MVSKDKRVIEIGNAINNWIEIDKILCQIELLNRNDIAIFDFGTLTPLKPTGVIMLINIIETVFNITKERIIIENITDETLAYLVKIKFFAHLNNLCEINEDKLLNSSNECLDKYKESNRWMEEYEDDNNIDTYESNIELIFIRDRIELNVLYNRIKTILDIWFPDKRYGKFRNSVLNALYEACDNSIEHSSGTCYDGECFLMLLKDYGIKDIGIQIVTGDIGIGIKNHLIQKYGEFSEKDSAYIMKALCEYSTGRLDDRGGMGLKDISDTVREYKGKLVIKSMRGVVSIGDKITEEDSKFSIKGTLTEILLKCEKKYIDM